jgi:glycosyltransferase involved in cell wall biosynthesis
MRILILHDPYKPVASGSIGGEDNLTNLEIEELRKKKHEVFDFRKFDSGLGRKLNQFRAQTYGSIPGLLESIKRINPDVIHTHNLSQRSGYAWMNQISIPIISSIHNYRLFCPASIAWRDGSPCTDCLKTSAIQQVIHNCDGFRGNINASRHLIFQRAAPQISQPRLFLIASELMGRVLSPIIPSNKLRILRNPGSLTYDPRGAVTKRFGWIFAGRFVEEKGIMDVIRSWPSTEKLDIAGDGPLKAKILKEIANKPNIKMIGTYPPGQNEIYLKYEGMIFASKWFEGSPLVIVDALGAGTPVITTDESAAAEQVSITQGGVVITGPLSFDKIVNAQKQIRDDFFRYSENGRRAVQNDFSITFWGNRIENLLEEGINL